MANEADETTKGTGIAGRLDGLIGRGGCCHCDGFGSKKTYDNQVLLPIAGRSVGIDYCIHGIVSALNAGGIRTVACCCGHGKSYGRISLADGRDLLIVPFEEAQKLGTPNAALEGRGRKK